MRVKIIIGTRINLTVVVGIKINVDMHEVKLN